MEASEACLPSMRREVSARPRMLPSMISCEMAPFHWFPAPRHPAASVRQRGGGGEAGGQGAGLGRTVPPTLRRSDGATIVGWTCGAEGQQRERGGEHGRLRASSQWPVGRRLPGHTVSR